METKRDSLGRKKRSRNKTVEIKIPKDTVKKKLLAYDVVEIKKHNGKEIWKPKARPELNFNDDLEILRRYNSEIRGLYNYFGIALIAQPSYPISVISWSIVCTKHLQPSIEAK